MASSKPQHIYQDNVITKARYEMSEAEKNIIYMVLAQVKDSDPVNKLYRVSVNEMAQIMGTKRLNFDAYKQATAKLISRVIECQNRETNNFLQLSFAASAEYIAGQGIIEIEISSKIRPFYVELSQRFSKLQLKSALILKSMYAKRIYELLSMYKNMKNPKFIQDIYELKNMLGIINEKTGKDSYPDYNIFQKRVLEVAKKEINGNTDIEFTYHIPENGYGIKKGRGRKPIERIAFEVNFVGEVAESDSPLFKRLTEEFKLRPDQAERIIEKVPLEHINKQLYTIHLEKLDGKVKNIGAYTASTFDV